MKKLLNTLYVTSGDAYLALDGENVVVMIGEETRARLPLHTLEAIVTFGYTGASPALMGKCAESNKQIVFLKPSGRFLARVSGKQYGNVILRREQYRLSDKKESLSIAKTMISAKMYNSSSVLRRAVSDHEMRIDAERVGETASLLKANSVKAYHITDADSLRGLEGESASRYFSVFNELILQQKSEFVFNNRNRRPPLDPVNAMLSFGYSLLTSVCVSALEAVGLDPYVGFFHTDRPGRCSLALDMTEELRSPFVDRFVLSLINKKMITGSSFITMGDGAVLLTDEARKSFVGLWQSRKKEELIHPYLNEKIEWGLVPHIQALLLAKSIRGDIDAYPPFLWK